jgi:hypothetical protein
MPIFDGIDRRRTIMNLHIAKFAPLLGTVLLLACSGAEPGQDASETTVTKAPLQDDGARLVPLREDQIKVVVGRKSAATVLEGKQLASLGDGKIEVKSAPYYVFGIGNGISNSDYTNARAPDGYYGTEPKFPPNNFFEATYSSRAAGAPENLWTTNGAWLQSGGLLDSEQTEVHYYWQHNDIWGYHVDVDYQVSSEANYDYLWINSTSSDGNCNNPGVVRKKVSGEQSGKVSFDIPAFCPNMWLGVYYIKDSSWIGGGDFARIKNVRIYANIPDGI